MLLLHHCRGKVLLHQCRGNRANCSMSGGVATTLIDSVGHRLLAEPPRIVCVSGPSGFVGRRFVDAIVQVHDHRVAHGLDPGELILFSSKPGRMMRKLMQRYGQERVRRMRASRVDYSEQLLEGEWTDHMGSLGVRGPRAVFVNLAGSTGSNVAMSSVNYVAPLAAARACLRLGFGHWIQASTQGIKAERGGQVPYSRWNMMIDHALGELSSKHALPVSIARIGMLYSRHAGVIGQEGGALNLIDFIRLPLTPVLGDGTAPLQPQEVVDVGERLAYLALSEPADRPRHDSHDHNNDKTLYGDAEEYCENQRGSGNERPPASRQGVSKIGKVDNPTLRVYDAVGPETMSYLQLMQRFASYQNCDSGGFLRRFRPVHIGYDNMDSVLKVQSIGNMNRQFVALLRSEQEGLYDSIVGDPDVWASLLGPDARLMRMDEAFRSPTNATTKRRFPYIKILSWLCRSPRVVIPCLRVNFEILNAWWASLGKR